MYTAVWLFFRLRCILKKWVYMRTFKIFMKYAGAQLCIYEVCYWPN